MLDLGSLVAERFRLLTKAAAGGTATVFRAFDEKTNSIAALKLFGNEHQDPKIEAEIFHRETTALNKLDHRSIVKLVDAGRCSNLGVRYLAVDWIEGITLKEQLEKSGAITWQSFFDQIGIHLLDAICHAFERDVSHRDISLRNVLITSGNEIKVIDFGQAKLPSVGVGITVAGWKTPPYSPPEEDTGRYSLSRDPYSFAAIAVRAVAGHDIGDHDQLYDALSKVSLPEEIRIVLEKALHRDPKQRFQNIIFLREALEQGIPTASESDTNLDIPVRFVPTAFKWLTGEEPVDELLELESVVLSELNEAAAVRLLPTTTGANPNRIQIETSSHRLVVDIDSQARDHLVVIGASPKRFSLDGLYKGDAWIADATFRLAGPQNPRTLEQTRIAIATFYQRLEESLLRTPGTQSSGDEFLDEWMKVLDAIRDLESVRVPPLKYTYLESSGRRLVVELENPKDAREDQVRTISKGGSASWAFKGEIESIRGRRCTLYSKAYAFDPDEIPREGTLNHDWTQSRKALDRQASAISRFRAKETPNETVRKLLLGEATGAQEPTFASVQSFYDKTLNDEKKALVSQFIGNQDLLLIHGPPGTGKTKLIVEVVRQELGRNPNARILLVSQTHVALDNALVGLVGPSSSIPTVRVVSGTKAMAAGVQHCSVEARGQQLHSQVEKASRTYLAKEAQELGIDFKEVELGIRASEVVRLKRRALQIEKKLAALQAEISNLTEIVNTTDTSGSTTKRDENRAKIHGLEEEAESLNTDLAIQKGQLSVARDALVAQGKEGKHLEALSVEELSEWCDLLLSGEAKARLRKLSSIADDWRLKFASSDDFKAAIIASSNIVAGTCVGFCREAAAANAQYDLCIVDEASKATTPELLLPLSRSKRAILIGDHHQLPPFVEHAMKSESLMQKHGLSQDLLEAQLFETLQENLSDGQQGVLKFQYRMRGGIGRLVSRCFYKGELESGLDDNETKFLGDLSLAGLPRNVVWFDTPYSDKALKLEQEAGTSYVNPWEVTRVVDLLERIAFVLRSKDKKSKAATIGVVSGYAAQVEALNREIGRRPALSALNIECNSVHAFQGREVDICVYSITRNNPNGDVGFLSDWRHLNVALSRARWHLAIIGSWKFCSHVRGDNPFKDVLSFVRDDADCELKPHEP